MGQRGRRGNTRLFYSQVRAEKGKHASGCETWAAITARAALGARLRGNVV
jgi:hypothetical protein